MAFRRSDDERDIYIRLQYLDWIRNQFDFRAKFLKVFPIFPAPGAHWPHPRQTAGKQAIQNLKVGPDYISCPDDSDLH
jgi:hypothetical protein